MPQYPVLQPDGKLAVWSGIVDHFIALDCTPDEATEVLARRYPDRVKIADLVAAVQRGEKVRDDWDDWPDCVAWAMNTHGPDDETVKDAMALTSDPMTLRYIDQVVATCRVERIADEARYELQQVKTQLGLANANRITLEMTVQSLRDACGIADARAEYAEDRIKKLEA